MHIEKIEIKNFRCFTKATFDLDADIVIIYGNNGSGKTTILESLHYLCYLGSFRSRFPAEVTQFDADSFFIKGTVRSDDEHTVDIQVGFAHKNKVAKVGNSPISSYKELFPFYQVVTLTIDDIDLICGAPATRRAFIDSAILLAQPDYVDQLKRYHQTLQQRNALLQQKFTQESYDLWTDHLWQQTRAIQSIRINALKNLQDQVSQLLKNFFDGALNFTINYFAKHIDYQENFEQFLARKKNLIGYETINKRSDFGIHLDDFTFELSSKKAKSFGSRGEQKLLVLLIKVAQILNLQKLHRYPIFLLDDFITDFDKNRLKNILDLLKSLKSQLIITSPIREKLLEELVSNSKVSTIELAGK